MKAINSKTSLARFGSAFFAAGVIFCGVAVIDADAQTQRRTKRAKQPVAQTVPLGEPIIVSRAGEVSDAEQPRVYAQPATENQTAPPTSEEQTENPNAQYRDLNDRVKSLETDRNKDSDAKQKRLMLNLDILTRSEQRAETLRKQLFDMIERESQIRTKLDQIASDLRPEVLERSVSFAGSLRPEELRDMRRKNLDVEKRNLENLLTEIQNTKNNLTTNVQKADALVERMRAKLEKEIDDALVEEPNN